MPLFETIEGATPIDDASGLIPTHITNRAELNEWETMNILKATRKYLSKKSKKEITVDFIKRVHRDMFDETWMWAGEFRKRNLNIGVEWQNTQENLKALADDIRFWEGGKMRLIEQSARIHHRLVKVHPFINGNGRHARLIADIFLFNHNHKLPNWPDKALIEKTNIRKQYLESLKDADRGDYKSLEKFTEKLIDGV